MVQQSLAWVFPSYKIKPHVDLKILNIFSMRRQSVLLNTGFRYFICLSTSAKIWITFLPAAEDFSYFPSKGNHKTQTNVFFDLSKCMTCNWKARILNIVNPKLLLIISDHFCRKSIMPVKSEKKRRCIFAFWEMLMRVHHTQVKKATHLIWIRPSTSKTCRW